VAAAPLLRLAFLEASIYRCRFQALIPVEMVPVVFPSLSKLIAAISQFNILDSVFV
jgi:hypothetical protein